jgi:predicted nuclease of predicted toxin-antitoxin system
MNWLIDNNLPLALAEFLRQRGEACVHVLELGWGTADDIEIWERSAAAEQIVVSKDEDFLLLASRPGDTGRMLWVRLGNCRNAALLETFERAFADIVRAFESGQSIVEIR